MTHPRATSGRAHPPRPCARIIAWHERRPRRAEALARRLLAATPPDSPDHPWALLTLGWCLLARTGHGEASAVLREAHSRLSAAGAHVGALRARQGLLVAAFLRGAPAEQQAEWEELVAALEAQGCLREAAQARITRLRHLNFLGRSHEALAMAGEVQAAVDRGGGRAEQAILSRVLGIAQLQTGNLAAADAALARAARGFQQLHYEADLAMTRFEQARVAYAQEHYEAALELQQRARAAFARQALPMWEAFCAKNIGAIEGKLGRPDRAITHLLAARDVFVGLALPAHAADCELNLGTAAYHSGLYDLALAAWRRAESRYAALGAAGMLLLSRRNQAEALLRLGQLASAATLLGEIIPAAEALGMRGDLGEALQVLGEVLHAQGEAEGTRAALQRAEQVFVALPNRPGAARAHLALGWLALNAGTVSEAEGHFEQAARDLADSPHYRWRASYGLGHCEELRGALQQALAHYRQACGEVACLRSSVADAHASSALFREARQLVADALRLAAAQHDPQVALVIAEQQRAITLQQQLQREPAILSPALRSEYEARRRELRTAAVRGATGAELDAALSAYLEVLFHGRHMAAPAGEVWPGDELDPAALREALGAQYGGAWTALVYVQTEEALLAITLDPERIHLDTIALDQRLRRMLERACLPRYRTYTYQDLPFRSGQRAAAWAELAALGEQLIPAEVRERLCPEHRLLIVPGGLLHCLPWAALRVRERWLVEQAVIQLIPGLQLWAELARRPRVGEEALLVGVSRFGGRAADLPSAIPSLDLAARHWGGAIRRLEDEAATRASLHTAAAAGELRQVGLLHLATHGQLSAGRGVLAHLKLADDDLLADEVAQLRLGGALVVLAACEGALGETLPGEELISLSWALLAAGARDVVASLWQLYDLMVLPMLEPFYAALRSGRDAPAALAAAQRACIRAGRERPDAPLGTPFVWASLCATGAGVPAGGTGPADLDRRS